MNIFIRFFFAVCRLFSQLLCPFRSSLIALLRFCHSIAYGVLVAVTIGNMVASAKNHLTVVVALILFVVLVVLVVTIVVVLLILLYICPAGRMMQQPGSVQTHTHTHTHTQRHRLCSYYTQIENTASAPLSTIKLNIIYIYCKFLVKYRSTY